MLTTALDFLFSTLLGLFTIACLLRCYLQLTGAPFRNPVSQAVVAVTNFAVRPLRRVVPAWGRLDTASLLLALLTQLLLQLMLLWLHDFPLLVADNQVYLAVFGLAALAQIKYSLYIWLYAVILQVILSWINPFTALAPVLDSLTRPLLHPLQPLIPRAGGVDLTPLVVFILIQLVLMLLIRPLEQQLLHLL